MQRDDGDGVVISCDFCGTDWDQNLSMIEGHHGSVICLACLKNALTEIATGAGTFRCVLCLREPLPEDLPRWAPESPLPAANPQAMLCNECMEQAARAFDRDPDVEWKRQASGQ